MKKRKQGVADRSAYHRAWVDANRERVRAQARARRIAKADEYKTREAKWRAEHPERSREHARNWYHKHKHELKFKLQRKATTEKNREARNAYGRSYHSKNRELRKTYKWKRYGVTMDDFHRMLAEQDSRCAICRRPETIKRKDGVPHGLAIDHDHETGVVRGLLCRSCNTALGLVRDSPKILMTMIAYLTRSAKGRVA